MQIDIEKSDLEAIRKIIGDQRFMQAASLVAAGIDTRQSREYMKNLKRLDDLLGGFLKAEAAQSQAQDGEFCPPKMKMASPANP